MLGDVAVERPAPPISNHESIEELCWKISSRSQMGNPPLKVTVARRGINEGADGRVACLGDPEGRKDGRIVGAREGEGMVGDTEGGENGTFVGDEEGAGMVGDTDGFPDGTFEGEREGAGAVGE
jgi:hypothetical protein